MSAQINGVQYSLETRRPEEISLLWKLWQLCFFICSTVDGFLLIYFLSDVLIVMLHNCVLGSKLYFVQNSDNTSALSTTNDSCDIDIPNSHFSNTRSCDIVMFTPVLTNTFGSFFAVMFGICGRGGASQSNPDSWKIVTPTVIFNTICFIGVLYAAVTFQSNLDIFLDNLKQSWGLDRLGLLGLTCLQIGGRNVGIRVSNGLARARLTVWLLVTFWGFGWIWIVLRFFCGIDFKLVEVMNDDSQDLIAVSRVASAGSIATDIVSSIIETASSISENRKQKAKIEKGKQTVTENERKQVSWSEKPIFIDSETQSLSSDSFHSAISASTSSQFSEAKEHQPKEQDDTCSFL